MKIKSNQKPNTGFPQINEIVDKEKAELAKDTRLCIMNPNLILAPQLQPGSEI